MIIQIFYNCNHDQLDTSKPLQIANQSEVPIKQYISVTCFWSVDIKSKYFFSFFALADIKYNILGTPFSEEYTKTSIFKNLPWTQTFFQRSTHNYLFYHSN